VEKIPWALENFFKDQNLSTLRELALREVAESVDRAGAARRLPEVKTADRVMVCLASNPPRAKTLLSRASRMAGRLNTDWFVVYVETPKEAPEMIDSEAQRHLLANIEKARELGGQVVRLKSDDPAQAILDFARTHDVAHIVVGRSLQPWWSQVLRGSVVVRLLREATEFDLHVVSFNDAEARA
jgi:two-component system sensor histidine kinase KdpD